AKYDVLGIGNAIFDILVQTDERFLGQHGMIKGGMALIDEARAASIYQDMGPAVEMSGGSAANTIVGIANLGARAAYVGKVKDDFVKASTIAHQAGRQVALTLSDSFCVDRYRGEFLDLMRSGTVDLVFANEAELHSLYQTSDFDTALAQLRVDAKLAVVTRSEKGCVVASSDGVIAVPAFPIEKMVDTTGAGDLFAAGFLFGLVRNAGHENAGRLGALAAAEVIQHIGAHPQVSLKELAKQNGLPV